MIGVDADSRRSSGCAARSPTSRTFASERLRGDRRALHRHHQHEHLGACDALVICVPTPLANQREPDLSYIVDAATALSPILREGQLVVLESTTYPGTTRDRLRPILEESGLAAGRDFHLAFSPERIDPGRTDYTIRDHAEGRRRPHRGLPRTRAVELYELICDEVVAVSTPEAAELAKLLENIFRSVNIALVNELAILCDRMEIDIWEVIDAAATKPFGFMRFDPGPGMGGHCLPVDPFYLAFKAREYDFPTEFVELAGKINQNQPHFCVDRVQRALNDVERPVKGLECPAARRLLQGRRRRHPRGAGAEDRAPPGASWAPRSPTTTPTCPS